jgi:hypothetical protein
MKALASFALVMAVCLLCAREAPAQYKAPSQYFPKNNPIPAKPGGQTPAAPRQPPAAAPQPKFKELPVNSQFYFPADTNRAFAWTKTSDTTARNTKNGAAQVINGETPVQR